MALGDDGFRVAMPDVPQLSAFRTVEVPPDRATMVDLVPPADAMTVVTTWERARGKGSAIATVHLRTSPDRPMTLVIMDARADFGVWLGLVARARGTSGTVEPSALDPSLLVPNRPRSGVLRKNFNAVITGVDERATRMLGWPPEHMIGVRSLEFVHPDDHERAVASWMEMLSQLQPSRLRMRHRRADGDWLWVETENVIVGRDDAGDLLIEAQMTDISDEMAAYEEVRQREELFHRLAESLPSGVVQVDPDLRIVYANTRLTAILGAAGSESLVDQLSALLDDDRARLQGAVETALHAGRDEDHLEVELRDPRTGQLRRCSASVVAVSGGESAGHALVSLTDVTDAARMREELRFQATYDALTGCLNRASVIAELARSLDDGERLTGVVYIDLDEFKLLNDTHGHAAGDEVLIEVARRVRDVLRDGDTVGRMGGDEFLVVCPRLADPDQALSIAGRVRENLRGPALLSVGPVGLRASIGVAIGTPGIAVDDLVARADTAMYTSKQERCGRVVLA
jgi:diguanylate cyclase (GGDEF)-like protein/PAS domain S-box-containing protein